MKNHITSKAVFLIALIATLTFPYSATAQKYIKRGLSAINAEQAQNYIGFLADDLLCGRDAGSNSGKTAAKYIASMLKDWGIAPLEEDYLSPFEAANGKRWHVSQDSVSAIKARGGEVRTMNNVLGVIPGEISDEYIVIGAHYDHEGIDSTLPDSIYNGADDNASGVSAVLQIAKAIKASGKRPLRTIIFAFWDGEEKGLLGSIHFTASWSKPEQIKGYMNFDMIGRGSEENPQYVKYLYTEAHPSFEKWLRDDVKKHSLGLDVDYRPWDKPLGGSDNGPFAHIGVPIVWYHTDGHPDYHRPSDSAEKINYKKVVDITRAAYLCAWRMANVKEF